MNKWARRLLSICLLLMANPTRADLLTVPLPATLNQRDIGELNPQVTDHQIVSLDLRPIRTKLEAMLPAEQYAKLQADNAGWSLPSQLESAGVHVVFDYQNLTLQLTLPPDQRRTETLSLIGTPDLRANRIVEPNDFAAYLNVRGGVNYIESSKITPEGFTEPQIALGNAFNLHGLVLENETLINPTADKAWEKRDTRLIYDMPEHRLRWTLGD